MKPLELTRSGIVATIAVFVVVAVCVRLGFWQLDRRAQKLERNEAVAERMAADPVALQGVPRDTAGLTYRRVTARGRIEGDHAVVLAGRSYGGAPGAHLLTPLRIGDGAVLVNRGWLPAPDAATVDLEPVRLEGEVGVEGVLLPFPDVELDRERRAGFQRTWFRLSGDALREQYPYEVSPLYIQATERPVPSAGAESSRTLPVILAAPSLDPGPHLSYAFQWFSFAGIFLVGWGVLLVRR